MTDWRMRLRDADRALGDDLVPEVAQRVRRSVLTAPQASAPRMRIWSATFGATAAALTLVCAGLLAALQSVERVEIAPALAEPETLTSAQDAAPAPERQQLQFATPGGTRIIWVFDPGFEVKGTLP